MPIASTYMPVAQTRLMPAFCATVAQSSTSRPRSIGQGSTTVRTP